MLDFTWKKVSGIRPGPRVFVFVINIIMIIVIKAVLKLKLQIRWSCCCYVAHTHQKKYKRITFMKRKEGRGCVSLMFFFKII